MKYYILTLGCQMNISDSQRIATKLEELGYKSAPEKDADLVVVNACSVRQHAVDRIWGLTKKWSKTGKKILVSGCVLPADKKKLAARDIMVFDINNLPNLPQILGADVKTELSDYFDVPMKLSGKIAYIPIMTGCDNFCSYCAVPYTRGREVSRPLDDILVEMRDAIDSGFKEIWLLGQNVNSYGINNSVILSASEGSIDSSATPQNDNSSFIDLLKEIDALPGDFKFNFMSSNPHDMGPELIDCFAGLKKWTRELHLAMQSGDDEILRKMNRKYSIKQFLELVSNLKFKIENLKLSTDIIVGFPGETKKQFDNTVKICKKIGFTKAFIGQYSPRPGTASAKMPDDVSPDEKKYRFQILDQLINR